MRLISRGAALCTTAGLDAVIALTVTPAYGTVATANVFLVILMIEAVAFVWLYSTRSNWRVTAAGRAVMALIGCVGIICGVGVINAFATNYPGRAFVRLGAFIAVGLVLMNLLLTLLDAQRTASIPSDEGTPP